jgi:hypothetical protein
MSESGKTPAALNLSDIQGLVVRGYRMPMVRHFSLKVGSAGNARKLGSSVFVIPQADGAPPIKITGFSNFVTTRAAAYCFLPGINALKFIANLA